MINKRVLLILGVVAIVLASTALSGCIGGNKATPTTTTPGTTTPGTTTPGTTTSGAKAQATQSGTTITVTGSSGNDDNSTDFSLEEGTYIYEWSATGTYADMFTATAESSDDKGGIAILSFLSSSGSSALVVGSMFTPAGSYHTSAASDGAYTIKFYKPTSGVAAPQTLNLKKGESKALALNLNAGSVTIDIKHSVAPTGTTSYGLYDLEGNTAASGMLSESSDSKTVEITTPGLYVFDITVSANTGATVTISQ